MPQRRPDALLHCPCEPGVGRVQVSRRHHPQRQVACRKRLARAAQRVHDGARYFALERRVPGWQRLGPDLLQVYVGREDADRRVHVVDVDD